MKRPGPAFNEASGTRAVNEATGAARLMKSMCGEGWHCCARAIFKLVE